MKIFEEKICSILEDTVEANVRVLTNIQNMLDKNRVDKAKWYIKEVLKSDKKEIQEKNDLSILINEMRF